jgi:hypothetical protein
MYTELLADPQLHALLLKFDEDLAAECHARGCRACAGKLHSGRYRRKPRGGPPSLPAGYEWRFSFCCAVDGCRKRAMPASLRYLSRKVYLGAVVVLITAMRCGPSPARIRLLRQLVGVSRHTVARWRKWWREMLPATLFWQAAAGTLMPPVIIEDLPASLFECFTGSCQERVLSLLRWLSPVSAGSGAVHAM